MEKGDPKLNTMVVVASNYEAEREIKSGKGPETDGE